MKKMLHKMVRANEFYLFLVILLLALVIQARSGQFFTANNIVNLANAMIVPGIFAVGAYMVIISGGIDVSFPALASLAVYAVTSFLVAQNFQGSILLPYLMVIGLGALLGAFNGLFASQLKVPTLIITLGTMSVFSGIMQGALKSVQIPVIPPSMQALGKSSLLVTQNPQTGVMSSLPTTFLIFVAVVAIVAFVMRYTMFGRGILAIGGDEVSAERAGFKVKQIKFWLYVCVGVIAATAGFIRTSMMGQMHPTNLLGTEMLVIAAVVLGGTSITGGIGSLTGVVLGTLLITMVQNSMILMGIPTFWQRFALGVLIIAGVAITAIRDKRARNKIAVTAS